MRKILKSKLALIIICIALVSLFSFSVFADDVGIIGGADGPTAIIVATEDNSMNFDGNEPFIYKLMYLGVFQFFIGTTAAIPALLALYLLTALAAYALGSLNFGIIISRLIYHDDIRNHGSANAGTSNMLRTYGKKAAIGTLLGDALKVVVAVFAGYLLVGKLMGGAYIAGLFAILGHVYPIYYKFKGGKGVVAAAITILMIDPTVFAVVLTVFVVVVAIWRYISLGAILAAAIYPLVTFASEGGPSPAVLFAFLIAVFVVFLHRGNIQRLLDGSERKLSFKKNNKKKNEDNKSDKE